MFENFYHQWKLLKKLRRMIDSFWPQAKIFFWSCMFYGVRVFLRLLSIYRCFHFVAKQRESDLKISTFVGFINIYSIHFSETFSDIFYSICKYYCKNRSINTLLNTFFNLKLFLISQFKKVKRIVYSKSNTLRGNKILK